ncbi:MAG: NUDIX domain-containing protein [Pseudomonadota bacterium]
MLTHSYQAQAPIDLQVDERPQGYSLVLLKSRGEGPFLVQQREKGPDVDYEGRIGLFGGRIESNETPEGCALREVLEETGLKLEMGDLTMLARIESETDAGVRNFGHLYVAENLDIKELRRLKIKEGKGLFLKRRELGRRHEAMTAITLFAVSAYDDLVKARGDEDTPLKARFGDLFGFGRR